MVPPQQPVTYVDTVIVGAGIAGVSAAYFIAPHQSVLILEQESQPAYHSTGRSAAMFMPAYGPAGVRALTRASFKFFLEPPIGFSDVPLLHPRGSLVIGQKGQEQALQAQFNELKPACPELLVLTPQECLVQVPVLRSEHLAGGVFDPTAMEVDVHSLHQGFLKGAKVHGAQLQCNKQVLEGQLTAHEDYRWTLRCSDLSVIRAKYLVNAAGAWGDHLATACKVQPQHLQPKRRSALTFDPPPAIQCTTWPLISSVDETFYFKPDAGRLLGSSANADPCPAHDVQPEELDIACAIDAIEQATTLGIRRPLRTWAGLRTFAPSGEPVIGWSPETDGFFWLVGQGGYGIQTSPAAGYLAAMRLLQSNRVNLSHPMDHSHSPATELALENITPLMFAPIQKRAN